jgi:hypothetical protein
MGTYSCCRFSVEMSFSHFAFHTYVGSDISVRTRSLSRRAVGRSPQESSVLWWPTVPLARSALSLVLAEPSGPLSRVVDEDPHGPLLGQRDRQRNPDGEESAHVVVMLGPDVPDDLAIAEAASRGGGSSSASLTSMSPAPGEPSATS